jgi:hypothetical protein
MEFESVRQRFGVESLLEFVVLFGWDLADVYEAGLGCQDVDVEAEFDGEEGELGKYLRGD